ncbi:TRICHOME BIREFRINGENCE-LIKE 36 [Euphorbia peplus]|nr:TRICHOME BIREFRINGENCE-LIKE 36 [Euphorbia peplus]
MAEPKLLLLMLGINLVCCKSLELPWGAIDRRSSSSSCDYREGRWVYDESYPLYDSSTCPYLTTPFACNRNGRPDSLYQKFKWKPHSCSLPRFDALKFLGKMRRKRIMLVGDSMMRNQWESLVCLVQGVIPTSHKIITYNGPSMAFHALDFETSIEFTWAPLLVELKKGEGNKRFLHLDLIEDNARFWRNVNVLVFDSAHWWTHSHNHHHNMTSWDYYMEGQSVMKTMNPMTAYQKALTTWAKWIDLNLDLRMTRVIFRSMSTSHNRENGWKCYEESEPLPYLRQQHTPGQVLVVKKVIRQMSFPVYLQDITTMSALRRDAHPSIYRTRSRRRRTTPSSDCNHWCLPGVPDTWNEILSAMF